MSTSRIRLLLATIVVISVAAAASATASAASVPASKRVGASPGIGLASSDRRASSQQVTNCYFRPILPFGTTRTCVIESYQWSNGLLWFNRQTSVAHQSSATFPYYYSDLYEEWWWQGAGGAWNLYSSTHLCYGLNSWYYC